MSAAIVHQLSLGTINCARHDGESHLHIQFCSSTSRMLIVRYAGGAKELPKSAGQRDQPRY